MPCRLFLTLALLAAVGPATAGEAPPDRGTLTVTDSSGKAHKLKSWTFTVGTRPLSWLDGDGGRPVEALEFTEGLETPLKVHVLSLIPLRHIRSIEFDEPKHRVQVRVATGGDDIVLEGLTGFVGVNVVAVEAEAELGGLGQARLKFQGGVPRGVKKLEFSAPAPIAPAPKGRPAVVIATGKAATRHGASGLVPVYTDNKGYRTGSKLYFQKTVEIELGKIQKLSQVGDGPVFRDGGLVFDVTLTDGTQNPLVLMQTRPAEKKKLELLVGLFGRTDAGYKLFPMQTVARLYFDDAVPPEKRPAEGE